MKYFIDSWMEPLRFSANVQGVVALRLLRLAGSNSETEARQMISEKLYAYGEAQFAIVSALSQGKGFFAAMEAASKPYTRRVSDNLVRLTTK